MYTFHKDHMTWQQAVGHEKRDMHRFKAKKDEIVYDLNNNEAYLTKMNEIKMKTFYGKHPMKYTGETQPDAPIGTYGVFAKLKDTNFRKTQDGWGTFNARKGFS